MKKKILLALLLIAILTCVFAISISAEAPSKYIEFGVRLSGSDAYVPAYTEDGEGNGNPRIKLDNPFYLDVNFTSEIDKSTITGLDFSNTAAYGGGNTAITRMTAASDPSVYANCTELKMPANINFSIGSRAFVNWTGLKTLDLGTCTAVDYNAFQETGIEKLVIPSTVTFIGNSAFAKCTSLKSVTISHDVKSIGTGIFQGCSSLTDVEISAMTKVNTSMFQNCTALVSIKLGNVSKLSEHVFDGCTSLTTVDISNATGLTEISKWAFNNCTALETLVSSGVNQEGAVIIPEGVTYIGQEAFYNCDSVKYLSLPSTVTYLGASIFRDSSGLEFIDFNNNANAINLDNWGHFNNCPSLKAASLPDGLKLINNRFMTSCPALQAVYLPANLEQMNTNGNGQGPFCYDGKMYFVNKPFEVRDENGYFLGDSFVMPEKPEIYYMPENLSKAGGNVGSGTWFRECSSLNNVIVMPEAFTESTVTQMFRGIASSSQRKAVVYLGRITNYDWSEMNKYIDFVFTHSENTDISTITFTKFYNKNNENSYFYFCSTGYRYTMAKANADEVANTKEENMYCHIVETTMSTEATCTMPKMTADYCFCGAIMGEPVTEGDALGHSMGEEYYVFNSLIEKGKTCKDCERCNKYTEEAEHENAILTDFGFSVKKFGSTYSFTNGYYVDKDLLNKYEITKGVSVGFGFAFNAEADFEYDGTLDSFKILAPIRNVGTGEKDFSAYTYQLTYADDTHIKDNLILGAYVIENNGESETLSFVNMTNGEFEKVSYNIALEKVAE